MCETLTDRGLLARVRIAETADPLARELAKRFERAVTRVENVAAELELWEREPLPVSMDTTPWPLA